VNVVLGLADPEPTYPKKFLRERERVSSTIRDEVSSVTAVEAAIPGPRGKEALRFLGFGSSGGMLEYFAETARRHGPIAQLRVTLGEYSVPRHASVKTPL
jgi:hypothetical protein